MSLLSTSIDACVQCSDVPRRYGRLKKFALLYPRGTFALSSFASICGTLLLPAFIVLEKGSQYVESHRIGTQYHEE